MVTPAAKAESAGQPVSSRSSRWQLIAFCSVAAVFYGLGIFWGLPSILGAASDSPAPLSPLNWIARYRDTSVSYIYPPVHQLISLAAYAVVLLGWKLAGGIGTFTKVYPYGFHNPDMVFSSLLVVTNLLSLAMAIGVLLSIRVFRFVRSADSWYSMLLLGLSGVFAYYARVGNMDMPYMFWAVLSWVMLWRYVFVRPDLKSIVFAAIAGALAIGTKDQSIGVEFGVGLTLLLVSPVGKVSSIAGRVKAALCFGGVLSLTYAVTSIAVNPWRWWAHIAYRTVLTTEPEYPASLWGECQVFGRFLIRVSHILTPAGLVLGILGLALLLRLRLWRKTAVLFLPAAGYYVLIIMLVRSTEERYLFPLAFALAVSAGVAAGELLAWTRRSQAAHALVMILLVAAIADQAVESFIPVTYCQFHDIRRQVAQELPSLVPPGSPLLLVRMNSFNIPDSTVYEQYRLMLPPDKKLNPPSTHGEHVLRPFDPQYRYVLAGSTLNDEPWPTVGPLVRRWTFPAWVKSRVYPPAVYEFALYRRGQ